MAVGPKLMLSRSVCSANFVTWKYVQELGRPAAHFHYPLDELTDVLRRARFAGWSCSGRLIDPPVDEIYIVDAYAQSTRQAGDTGDGD